MPMEGYAETAGGEPPQITSVVAGSQSALFVIVEPGPANAGALKATARATARMVIRLFMAFLPYAGTSATMLTNSLSWTYVPRNTQIRSGV